MSSRSKTYLMALLVLVIVLLLRSPAFWTPILDVDESQFAGYANALLDGGSPFLSSVDTKPIGIYIFFSVIFLLFGRNNMFAVHLITAIWVWITALYCYRIGRTIHNERTGWLSAIFYAVFTVTYIPKFISTSIILVLMLPLTMSIYYIIKWEQDRDIHNLFNAGMFFGIACLFKYQAGINLILVGIYFLFLAPHYLKESGYRQRFRPFLIFIIGGTLVGFIFFLYLKYLGIWDAFFFWSILGSNAYIEAGITTSDFFSRLLVRGGSFMASTLLLWVFGIREVVILSRRLFKDEQSGRRPEPYLIMLWFLTSLIPVATGGRFFGHYFIQLLPSLSILAAMGISFMMDKPLLSSISKKRLYAIVLVGMLFPAAGFTTARIYADKIYAKVNEDNPNSYRPLGEYIKERTEKHDTIFVWGFATPVYFFANRPAASRFLWCDWLTGRIAGSPTAKDDLFDTTKYATPGSWDMFFADLKENKPVYFVDTSPGNYHDYGKYPVSGYPKLMAYLNDNYTLESTYKGADFYRRKDEN
ncbi:MAG: hypothetical protein HN337_09125 [Deltaproteobacteria bacterium]|nr:hypothetical protein [Deltaproteobacteria bacterium]